MVTTVLFEYRNHVPVCWIMPPDKIQLFDVGTPNVRVILDATAPVGQSPYEFREIILNFLDTYSDDEICPAFVEAARNASGLAPISTNPSDHDFVYVLLGPKNIPQFIRLAYRYGVDVNRIHSTLGRIRDEGW